MKLIPEAWQWHRLWSVRLALLAGLLSALELVLPLWSDLFRPRVFAILSTVVAFAAAIARVVQQPNVIKRDDANSHS